MKCHHCYVPEDEELGLLANHHLDYINSRIEFFEYHRQWSGSDSRMEMHYSDRLTLIREILGDEKYEEATREITKKWEKKFAELEKLISCDFCDVKHEPPACANEQEAKFTPRDHSPQSETSGAQG